MRSKWIYDGGTGSTPDCGGARGRIIGTPHGSHWRSKRKWWAVRMRRPSSCCKNWPICAKMTRDENAKQSSPLADELAALQTTEEDDDDDDEELFADVDEDEVYVCTTAYRM